ncbi:MAG: hypothetical protein IJP33_00290 [Firmicutes bacterium]|nr:hypothetical protein [Bacillota bacterium]
MENYRDFLPELKTIPLFYGIEDDALIALLEAMQPKIIHRTTNNMPPMRFGEGLWMLGLKNNLNGEIAPRENQYAMPNFGEPGAMMGEVPGMSEAFLYRKNMPKPAAPPKPAGPPKEVDDYVLEMSSDMMTKFYSDEVYPAQAQMNRNMLGIMAEKVTHIRKMNRAQIEELQNKLAGK